MCKSSANVEGTRNFAIKLFGATIPVCVRDESSQEENNTRKRPGQAEMAANSSKSLKTSENLYQKGEIFCNLREKGAKSSQNIQEKSESFCNLSDRGAKSLKRAEICEEKSGISCNIEASDQKPPPKPEKPVACPRCHSLETKFCYFNNYNVNQPRHFCKNCRRYWTAGGSMRNIPVGAGRRKSKHFTAFHLSKSMDLQDQKMKLDNFVNNRSILYWLVEHMIMAFKVVRWIVICVCVALLSDFQTVSVNGDTFTTSSPYDPPAHNYSIDGLYCATYDSNQTLQWRSQYFWTAYCDKAGQPMGSSLCGTCIQVTNDSTGQKVTVRILDRCQNGGLVLETDAFKAIDGDGQGRLKGHMLTTYQFVYC